MEILVTQRMCPLWMDFAERLDKGIAGLAKNDSARRVVNNMAAEEVLHSHSIAIHRETTSLAFGVSLKDGRNEYGKSFDPITEERCECGSCAESAIIRNIHTDVLSDLSRPCRISLFVYKIG